MRKAAALLLFLLGSLGTGLSQVSFVTVSGTVTDPNANPYANAAFTINLVDPLGNKMNGATTPNGQVFNGKQIQGTLDAAGHFSVQLVPTNILNGGGSCKGLACAQWQFSITPPADSAILTYQPPWAITYQTAITSTVDLSSQLSALTRPVNYINLVTGQSTIASPNAISAGLPFQAQYNCAGKFCGSLETLDAAGNVTTPGNITKPSTTAAAPAYAAWGDSLLAGGQGIGPFGSVPATLQTLLGVKVINNGYSGYTSTNIAVLQGAVPTFPTGSVVIPACTTAQFQSSNCTPVAMTLSPAPAQNFTGSTNYFYCTLKDIQGYYWWDGAAHNFTPVVATAGATATTADRCTPTTDWTQYVTLADIGRNDVLVTGCAPILANLAAIAANSPKGYVFGAILNGDTPTEWTGTANFNTIVACNASIAAVYAPGGHWVQDLSANNYRQQLVALSCAGTDPVSISNCTNGVRPASYGAYYGLGILAADINNSTTSVQLTFKVGPSLPIAQMSGQNIILDTGSNAEEMQISGTCSGSSPTYTCTVIRGTGGTQTSHTSGAAFNSYDYLHMNGDVGYPAGAQIWANFLQSSLTAQSPVMTLRDYQALAQNQNPQPAAHIQFATQLTTQSIVLNQFPGLETYITQANDGYGSLQIQNNLVCKFTFTCDLGIVSGTTPIPFHTVRPQIIEMYNLNDTNFWSRILQKYTPTVNQIFYLNDALNQDAVFLMGGDSGTTAQTFITNMIRGSGCPAPCEIGGLHAGFDNFYYAKNGDITVTAKVTAANITSARTINWPDMSGSPMFLPTTPAAGGIPYLTAANTDLSGTSQVAPNATTTTKALTQTGNGSVASAPIWTALAGTGAGITTGPVSGTTAGHPVCYTDTGGTTGDTSCTQPAIYAISSGSSSIATPLANTTYLIGSGGIGGISTSGNKPSLFAAKACTATYFDCSIQVAGTLGTGGDAVTCGIWDLTAGAALTGVSVSVPVTAVTNVGTAETSSTAAVAQSHKLLLYFITPGIWSQQPTTVSAAGNMGCQ